MSQNMLAFSEALFNNLIASILALGASSINAFAGAPFFGQWFNSPLARNDYNALIERVSAALTVAPVSEREHTHIKTEPLSIKTERLSIKTEPWAVKREPGDGNESKKTIVVLDSTDMTKHVVPNHTVIDLVGPNAVTAVTTTSYDGRSRIGTDTLNKIYGTEQRAAVETLKDDMERRFATGHGSVVDKIAQTLCVLALEPVDLSMEMVLQQRFEPNIVVEDLMYLAAQQTGTVLENNDMNEDDADEDGSKLRDFKQKLKRYKVNLFPRFPELAIDCADTKSSDLLRAVSSLWVCSGSLFGDRRALPHSETARSLHEQYRAVLERVLGDRSQLLYATIVTNIEGIGPRRWLHFKQLFCAALAVSGLHVAKLQNAQPDNARVAHAYAALATTLARVRHYTHSSVGKKK
jgi:hypothetical protein